MSKSRALFGDGISHFKPLLGHFKPPQATHKVGLQEVPKRGSSPLLLSPKKAPGFSRLNIPSGHLGSLWQS